MLKKATIKNGEAVQSLSYPGLISAAMEHEKKEEPDEAAALYLKAVKVKPSKEVAYHRLMVVYRKQKLYKKEVDIINAGIKVFEELYRNKKKVNIAVARLSKSISINTGLVDKKGQTQFEFQPLVKWRKRLNGLNKKMKPKG